MKRYLAHMITVVLASTVMAAERSPTPMDLLNRRVMVLGDSITQQGTWVAFLQYYLLRDHPRATVDLISIGLASETASGLSESDHPFPRPCVHERLERALHAIKPEVVIACYGMNDGIYHPSSPEREKAFRNGITRLIRTCQAHGARRIFLLSPGTFGGIRTTDQPPYSYKAPCASYDDVLAGFTRWLMGLQEEGVHPIDLHTPMWNFEASRRAETPAFQLAKDGIHPEPLGHLIMARAVLAAVGMPLPEDFEKELATINADPLQSLVQRYRHTRSSGWLPYVGFTRNRPVKSEEIESTEKSSAGIMNEIDKLRRK